MKSKVLIDEFMVHTFEFIQTRYYARRANNGVDLLNNYQTYLPLFEDYFLDAIEFTEEFW
jgi:hypothetical protein